jgi:acyl-CoA thioesterase-1
MMHPTIRSIAAGLGILALTWAWPACAQKPSISPVCEVPQDMLTDSSPLTHAAKRMRLEKRLKIVALGSSSTLGVGASGPTAAYPARLEEALAKMLPDVAVQSVNKGVARQTAVQMVERLDADVLPEKPAIVIWETGTAEAVRGGDLDTFSNALLAGIDKLQAAGIDVVLMDTQYSRTTAQLINFQPYVAAVEQVAGMRDLILFPRYYVMHYWVDAQRFNFADRSSAEMRKVADTVYDCIGQLLARNIAQALKPAR